MIEEDMLHLPNLTDLLGLRLLFRGELCRVVEVLEIPPTLVLESLAAEFVIEPDAYGRPAKMGHAIRLVQVMTSDRLSLSDELLDLELLD